MVRLLHQVAHKVLILFLVLSLPQAVAAVHQAEMEVFLLLLVVLVAAEAVAVVALLKLARLAQQVKETLVEMVVQRGKIIPAQAVEVLVP